jgi:hypothetical protein
MAKRRYRFVRSEIFASVGVNKGAAPPQRPKQGRHSAPQLSGDIAGDWVVDGRNAVSCLPNVLEIPWALGAIPATMFVVFVASGVPGMGVQALPPPNCDRMPHRA